jgi:uncharacterized protein YbcI
LTVGQFEAWMREALIKIHKDATGRGPQDAYVRLFKNCIVFCLEDTLTALERQLLNSGWGEEEIGQLRFNLLKEVIIPRVQEKITEKVPANILDAATIVRTEQQAQYGLFILDKNIEKICAVG